MKDNFDNEIQGQMTINDLFNAPETLIGVSRIFARARKEMSLNEQKTFVYALSNMRFTEKIDKNYVTLDKKVLANILNLHSDSNHLSQNLFEEIKDMNIHSRIRIAEKDYDLYTDGFIITTVISCRNYVKIRFNEDFLPLFTNLSSNYITLWSTDIFKMTSKRSVQFYEYLRQNSDTRQDINSCGLGIKAFKELFEIPKEGKGSYMRADGTFDRSNFEKYVIEPLCEDLKKCRMINLVVQKNGKYYEKVKKGNRVSGYRFYWVLTEYPKILSATEEHEIKNNNDGITLKIAKDILESKKKIYNSKKEPYNGRSYTKDEINEIVLKKLRKNDF